MAINTIRINNSKLTPGKFYWFKIIKTIELDQANSYFVLEDPMGYKVLLPKDPYVHYNLIPGEKISCRVDKINCKGQMFIEPVNPHYKEGETYTFQYVASLERLNFYDEKEFIIIVSDMFNNKWEVKTNPGNHIVNSSEVNCKVKKIKKGKLYLHRVGDKTTSQHITSGKYYDFKIISEKTNPVNKRKYYILEDKDNNRFPLQKKYYLNYRFKIGQVISCHVDRLSAEGYYLLEPEHPHYKIGEKYKFLVLRIDHLVFPNNKQQCYLILEDVFGEEVTVDLGDNISSLLIDKENYECVVKDIHKGKPVLQIT